MKANNTMSFPVAWLLLFSLASGGVFFGIGLVASYKFIAPMIQKYLNPTVKQPNKEAVQNAVEDGRVG